MLGRKMKQCLLFVLVVLALAACSEDYDAFGSSDYRSLDDLAFENQEGETRFYSDEHRIEIDLVAPSDSFEWDSVTVEHIKISHFASLHLVESKVRKFPSDSAKLDSIAKKVAYSKEKLGKGSTFRLPHSCQVYVLAISESGKGTIWQVTFNIQGGNVDEFLGSDADDSGEQESNDSPASSSSSKKKSDSSSSGESDDSSSDKDSADDSSSDEVVLDSNVSFSIKFIDQLESREEKDTIRVVFAHGTNLSKVKVDTSESFVFRKSSVDSDPAKVKDWSKLRTFVVTSESGASKTWYVDVVALPSNEKNFEIVFNDELKSNRIDDTIVVRLINGTDIGKASVDSWSVSEGASISPNPDSVKNWSKLQKFEIVAEDGSKVKWFISVVEAEEGEVVSDEKELLSVKAKNEVKAATIDESKKTVQVHMKKVEDLANVELFIEVSPSAYINLESKVDLRLPQKLVITAEDKSTAEWIVSGDYVKSNEADILEFVLDDAGNGFSANVNLDAAKKSISFTVSSKYESKLSKVYFDAVFSDGARKAQPAEDYLDLSDGSAEIVVVAEDGTEVTWTVSVAVKKDAVPPRLLSMKIAGNTAEIDSVDEGNARVFHVHYDDLTFLADLTQLVVSDVRLSEGATITGLTDGNSYDLGRGVDFTVTNGDESVQYEVRAGYQYPNSNLEDWDTKMDKPKNWDNGNQKVVFVTAFMTQPVSTTLSGKAASLQSLNVSKLSFASGNLFVGTFNPKGVDLFSMASDFPDGNELIDFGKPFKARPRYLEIDFKYNRVNQDSCDVYIILENRTRTASNGSNVGRTKNDVNTLVASAWYRATTDSSLSDPDVVSISGRNADGLRRLRLKLKYGQPYQDSPIMNIGTGDGKVSVLYAGDLSSKQDGIDNHLVVGDGTDDVTHLRIVVASSADGNHYQGSAGSTLIVDNFRLIY